MSNFREMAEISTIFGRRSQTGSWPVKLSICHPKIHLLPWISCIGLLLNIYFTIFRVCCFSKENRIKVCTV